MIVSKTSEHPRMLSGFIHIANIIDTIGSSKNGGHPKMLWFSKVSQASVILAVTLEPFHNRGHGWAPQFPQAPGDTSFNWDSLLRSKAISRTFAAASIKSIPLARTRRFLQVSGNIIGHSYNRKYPKILLRTRDTANTYLC